MAKKSMFEKRVLLLNRKSSSKFNEDQKTLSNRFLITINILGSAGPMRIVVDENDVVSEVIETALKSYAREKRLPVLGSDATNFFLYCSNAGFDALNPMEAIGSFGVRNFVLSKKQADPTKTEARSEMMMKTKGSGRLKAWLNKSFSFNRLVKGGA